MTDKVASAAGDAKGDLDQLRGDLSKLSDAVATLMAQQSNTARAAMSNAANRVREQGEAAYREAEVRARQKARDLEQTIVENPFASVGAALGIGLLLGLFSRRH